MGNERTNNDWGLELGDPS